LWSNGQTGQSITVSSAGQYSVTVSNSSGCTAVSAATTVVQNSAPPVPTISPSGTLAICPGTTTTLTAPAGYTYLWSNGATTQSISVGAGNYTVTVTNANG